MELRSHLQLGLSREHAERVMQEVGDDPIRFKELITIMVGTDRKAGQRAAYAADLVTERHPQLVVPHLSALLAVLDRDVHEGVHRSAIRIMQHCELPEKWHG